MPLSEAGLPGGRTWPVAREARPGRQAGQGLGANAGQVGRDRRAAGFKCRLPGMTTPPHRPTRTIGRRGPLLRNPRAPPEQLGGPPWPQELASAGVEGQALFTCNHQACAQPSRCATARANRAPPAARPSRRPICGPRRLAGGPGRSDRRTPRRRPGSSEACRCLSSSSCAASVARAVFLSPRLNPPPAARTLVLVLTSAPASCLRSCLDLASISPLFSATASCLLLLNKPALMLVDWVLPHCAARLDELREKITERGDEEEGDALRRNRRSA